MTDITVDTNNDILIQNGVTYLLETTEELVRQRLINHLNTFTDTLFTDINYGIDQTLVFAKGTQSLLDQDIKAIISNTTGVVRLVNFTSTVSPSRVYTTDFRYEIETGEIVGVANLGIGSSGIINRTGVFRNGVWDYLGTWDDEEIWGQ